VNLILHGIGGSRAHGLAGPGSDVDWYGVHAAPTLDLVVPWSEPVVETYRCSNPDVTIWEIGHYARLIADCNPTPMELLWLDKHDVRTHPYGDRLIELRTDFLAAELIRARYAGMVREQLRRLSTNPEPAKARKLVRHGLRVAEQAVTLLRTGRLVVRAPDPERYRRFDGDPWSGRDALVEARAALLDTPALAVPEKRAPGSLDALRAAVQSIRLTNLNESNA
jgi:uncharacterized protein